MFPSKPIKYISKSAMPKGPMSKAPKLKMKLKPIYRIPKKPSSGKGVGY